MGATLTDTTLAPPGRDLAARPQSEDAIRRQVNGPRVRMTRVGLVIPADLSYDDWASAGHHLSGIIDSSSWCLGDWLVYGKKHYTDRYQRAIRAAGLQYQTLRNYAWVARRFEVHRRRAELSFQHHAEVASLPLDDQTFWLDEAEKNMWTTKQLRRHIQGSRTVAAKVDQAAVMPPIEVIGDRLDRWRWAAEHTGANFDSWVVSVLDDAAKQILDDVTTVDACGV